MPLDDYSFVTTNEPQKSHKPNEGKGLMYCFQIFGILCLVLIGSILFLVMTGITTFSNFWSGIIPSEPANVNITSGRTVITSIQPLGQLVSVSAEVAKADILVEVHQGGVNLCGHSAYHVAEGAIEAGVNLSAIDETNITYDTESNTYTISLPSPQVTSCRIDYIRQYEKNSNVGCSPDWDIVRMLAQYEATVSFAQDSIESGLLERARRETDLLLTNFIQALTGSTVEIVYLEREATVLPSSCSPRQPNGWVFDEEIQQWRRP